MRSLTDSMRRLAEALADWRVPTWLLGVVVALLGWRLTFALPGPGLDPSWWAGLYMATHEGMQFGTDIVFTYGPLGFLGLPWLWYGGLASVAFIYLAAVYLAFACALVWTFRARLGAPFACLISVLIIAGVPGINFSIALAALWAFAVLTKQPPRHSLTLMITAGAVFAAIEALGKLSSAPVIFLVLLIALIGARASRKQVAAFLGIYAFSVGALWLIAGQKLSHLPDFAINSLPIVSGYNEAMASYTSSRLTAAVMVAVVVLTLVWARFGEYPGRRARYASLAVALIVAMAMYKQGVVRSDTAHVAIFFGMLTVLWAGIPTTRRLTPGLLVGVAILGAIAIHKYPPPGVDVIGNVKTAKRELNTLVSPSLRDQAVENGRSTLKNLYALEPEILEAMEGRSVSVDPWEIAVAWAYELDWSPLPVFQNYSAYTTGLDKLNSDALESPEGPDTVLKQNTTFSPFDGRYPTWDPPAQALATLCNFFPAATTLGWQVLSRVPDRCAEPVSIDTVEGSFNEAVEVPAPKGDEVVFVRINGAEVHGLEKLRSLLYKPKARYASISDGRIYRLVPATAADGLILRAGRKVAGAGGPFTPIPQTDTLELGGTDGDLEFEFFSMKISPPAPAGR